jgi:hypothetical protein
MKSFVILVGVADIRSRDRIGVRRFTKLDKFRDYYMKHGDKVFSVQLVQDGQVSNYHSYIQLAEDLEENENE